MIEPAATALFLPFREHLKLGGASAPYHPLAGFEALERADINSIFPDHARAVSPFIFSVSAFASDGTPKYQTPTAFGEGNGDIPNNEIDFSWTNYGTGNVETGEVDAMIKGELSIDKTLEFGDYIGQANGGYHSYLFSDVNTYMSGEDWPAAIVDANGNFAGWATFHVISADGGGSKTITGYFVTASTSSRLSVKACAANDCPRYLGTYVLKLFE